MRKDSERWERPSTDAEERRALRRARRLCKDSEPTGGPLQIAENITNAPRSGIPLQPESASSSEDRTATARSAQVSYKQISQAIFSAHPAPFLNMLPAIGEYGIACAGHVLWNRQNRRSRCGRGKLQPLSPQTFLANRPAAAACTYYRLQRSGR